MSILHMYIRTYLRTYNLHRLERRVYHKHIQKARANSRKYMTIIIDGMDQKKTSLPFLPRESKTVQVGPILFEHTYTILYSYVCTQH